MQGHGDSIPLTDHAPPESRPSDVHFGRMFPDLPGQELDRTALVTLGAKGGPMDEGFDDSPAGTSTTIPAGYVFLGQFMTHDISFDVASSLDAPNNLAFIENARSHSFDLDCIYGGGPVATRYFYDVNDRDKLLIGINDAGNPDDVPRNQQGLALIGDPRNDVDVIVSQLHLAFLKFHNSVIDHLRSKGAGGGNVFEEARRLVRWHYQWIVVHEYLTLHVGRERIDEILANGRQYCKWDGEPFIPVEFSVAAFRFGHSQLRSVYSVNDGLQDRLFSLPNVGPVPARAVVEWSKFFATDPSHPPQMSRKISGQLAGALIDMPGTYGTPDELRSLAVLDLLRGRSFALPSGQAVARAMGVRPLTEEETGFQGEAPLWLYILKEAEVQTGGERLGEVGGRMVAEVVLGLLQVDPRSYLCQDTPWKPTLPSAVAGEFTIVDLLRFAGVV